MFTYSAYLRGYALKEYSNKMSVGDAQIKEFLEEINTKGIDLPAIGGTVAEYEAEGTVIDICKTALEKK